MRVRDARQTFLGIWLRRALADEEIHVYGDGGQRRDFTYVDDAVARLPARRPRATRPTAGSTTSAATATSPCSSSPSRSSRSRAAAASGWSPSPPDRKAIDIGDFYADYSGSSASSAGRRASALGRASRGRSSTTASTARTTGTASERAVPRPRARDARRCAREIDAAIERVLESGRYILGEEVDALRSGVRRRTAAPRTPSASHRARTRSRSRCWRPASAPGDEVITAPNTCVPTIVGIERAGRRPGARRRRPGDLHARPGRGRAPR